MGDKVPIAYIVIPLILLFPIFFVALFSLITFILSRGGWNRLASLYAVRAEPLGNTFYRVTGLVGRSAYKSALKVIVTGAGSGIGEACARRFSAEGAAVVLAGRTKARLDRVAADLPPERTLVKVTEEGPEQIGSDEYFAGRRVALFSVPGAFTPTCSAKHLPGFVEKASELKAKGIDEIACTAVNDTFVMKAWGKASEVNGSVTMLADGNGSFAKALGLEMDGSAFGLGTRGKRYSMVVNDGTVEQLNVEAPGQFEVSSAEYMLGRL